MPRWDEDTGGTFEEMGADPVWHADPRGTCQRDVGAGYTGRRGRRQYSREFTEGS